MSNEEEPFLKRWSRRKTEARDGAAPDSPPAPEAPAPAEGDASDRPAAAKERPLTEADFADVDFDALDAKSDYSRFLAKGVPDAIKQRALRKLWASDPVLSQVEPFQEWAGDFTDRAVAVPAGMLRTAYKVGRGFMSDEDVAAWEKLGKPVEEKPIAAGDEPAPRGPAREAAAATAAAVPAEPQVALHLESPAQPEVESLIRQLDADLASLDPARGDAATDIAALDRPNVRFAVVRRDAIAAGCAALVIGASDEADIQCVFVAPEFRRQGLGRRLLQALEEAAKVAGLRATRLTIDERQSAALALCAAFGYAEREPFGTHGEHMRFLEKPIA